jgi:hypothetical protein
MRTRLAVAAAAVAALLAGCANVVDGSGTTGLSPGPTGGSSTGGFPTPTGSASTPSTPSTGPTRSQSAPQSPTTSAPPPTACPRVTFPRAKLSFDCFTTGMTAQYDGTVWPLRESKRVEAKTGWVLEEGAGHWGPADGRSLGDIAYNVRQQMIADGGYGTGPSFDTTAAKDTTIAGVRAHLLQTTFTINPAWAKTRGTKVKQEKLWIVALQVGSDDVSLWYASVPDLVKSLWAKVPATINSIKVG